MGAQRHRRQAASKEEGRSAVQANDVREAVRSNCIQEGQPLRDLFRISE
jgi:hypothetical protein